MRKDHSENDYLCMVLENKRIQKEIEKQKSRISILEKSISTIMVHFNIKVVEVPTHYKVVELYKEEKGSDDV